MREKVVDALTVEVLAAKVAKVGSGEFVALMGAIQLAWYVAVIVLLYKIWSKVRHLPA